MGLCRILTKHLIYYNHYAIRSDSVKMLCNINMNIISLCITMPFALDFGIVLLELIAAVWQA